VFAINKVSGKLMCQKR